jgi:hypothetical protein
MVDRTKEKLREKTIEFNRTNKKLTAAIGGKDVKEEDKKQ